MSNLLSFISGCEPFQMTIKWACFGRKLFTLCLFRCTIYAKIKYFTCKIYARKYFHFTVFGNVHENVVQNIFQCLAQNKIKKLKKFKK